SAPSQASAAIANRRAAGARNAPGRERTIGEEESGGRPGSPGEAPAPPAGGAGPPPQQPRGGGRAEAPPPRRGAQRRHEVAQRSTAHPTDRNAAVPNGHRRHHLENSAPRNSHSAVSALRPTSYAIAPR